MKSWKCIKNCGACCKFDLSDRADLSKILTSNDIALINSMTSKDGWCKHLDKSNNKCMIYESRPHFCRVSEFSTSLKGYIKNGDKFLIDCCKQHISSIYGSKSEQMIAYKMATTKK